MWAFLKDYGIVIASTAAVLNGFIALTIAQIFKDRPWANLSLVIIAGIIGIVSVGATILSQKAIVASADQQKQNRTIVRDQLGSFIQEGNVLQGSCRDPSKPPPVPEGDAWNEKVVVFLSGQMGSSFVARFQDPSDIPYVTANMNNGSMADQEHQNVWFNIHYRIIRLQQFSQQIAF